MSTEFLRTVVTTAVVVCLAALLAVATTQRERAAGHALGYGVAALEDPIRSR